MQQEFLKLVSAREGHFRYESGYHGSLWFDLDRLFVRPNAVRPLAAALAARLARYNLDAVCGPLVGGALVAQMVATELDIDLFYTERVAVSQPDRLYPVEYRLPGGVRQQIHGKNVAIVDDVISAGSAVRGTLAELRTWGARPVVVGALLILGDSAAAFFAGQQIPLESVATLPGDLWLPADCPLCRAGIPLEDITADASRFPPKSLTGSASS
ncbi:MAG: orotate phosphoribosyltransferase [Chloroflexi bacterium]|nr:orotate phosphoribosyltransferase [Chloroflexota bacterium]